MSLMSGYAGQTCSQYPLPKKHTNINSQHFTSFFISFFLVCNDNNFFFLTLQEDYAGAEVVKKQMEDIEAEKAQLTAATERTEVTETVEERIVKEDDHTW